MGSANKGYAVGKRATTTFSLRRDVFQETEAAASFFLC